MKRISLCFFIAALSLVACKKEEAKPSPLVTAPPPVSSKPARPNDAPPTEAPAITVTTPEPVGVPAGTKSYEVPIEAFNTLREALVGFQGKHSRLPRDWNELVAAGFLKRVPPPPQGKKYIFDASLTVRMVDK